MKLMSPKAFYYTVGKKNFFQYILFGIFVLFFYLPLMNLCMLAFADKYEVPARNSASAGGSSFWDREVF